VVNVNFTEVDAEGNPLPGGITKDNSLLVKYFIPEFREQLIGKKKDDSIILQLNKAFEEQEKDWLINDLGLKKDDQSAGERNFKMTITKVGLVEKTELNEEFFKQVFPEKELKNEDEFRQQVKDDLQTHWDSQSRRQLHDQLYHF